MKLITEITGKKYDFTAAGEGWVKLGFGAEKGNTQFAEYFQVVDNGSLGGSVASFTIEVRIAAKVLYRKMISVRVGSKYFFTEVEKAIMTSPSANNQVSLQADPGVSIYYNKVIEK